MLMLVLWLTLWFQQSFVKQLNTIKFNTILKFIIHLSTIYINPMFTFYLISVGLGDLGEDVLALI